MSITTHFQMTHCIKSSLLNTHTQKSVFLLSAGSIVAGIQRFSPLNLSQLFASDFSDQFKISSLSNLSFAKSVNVNVVLLENIHCIDIYTLPWTVIAYYWLRSRNGKLWIWVSEHPVLGSIVTAKVISNKFCDILRTSGKRQKIYSNKKLYCNSFLMLSANTTRASPSPLCVMLTGISRFGVVGRQVLLLFYLWISGLGCFYICKWFKSMICLAIYFSIYILSGLGWSLPSLQPT